MPPHTPNTFTEIDKRTTHITTHNLTSSTSAKKKDPAYIQPPPRGVDDFVNGQKGSCFIISAREKGKEPCYKFTEIGLHGNFHFNHLNIQS